ncbi:MAG: cytochrome c [Methylophilaceae bacterium]
MKFRNIAVLVTGVLTSLLGVVPANAAGDVAKAAPIVTQLCAACHGVDGNSMVPMYPTLAGQHPEYITKQLTNFKAGDRKNPVMSGMVVTLTPEDMVNLGAYFGTKTAKAGTAKSNGAGSVGEKIYRGGIPGIGVPACASCHGPTGAGVPVQFPRLAGQHADYIVTQLKAFRSGERVNDGAKMMRMVAAKLSDEDVAAVADYIQGLH